MPQRNLLVLLVALAISYVFYVVGEQNPYARYVGRSLDLIDDEALQRVPDEELFRGALDAMVGVLHRYGDEHSQFIPSDQADPLRDEMRQQFGGIGVRIRFLGDPPELVVVGAPEPNTPAARADIRSGDYVLEIDGRPTTGMSMGDVLRLMRGPPGEEVRLVIRHADADRPETKVLVREVIHVDSILGDRRTADGHWEFRLEQDPRIAQVRVTTFGNKTTDELVRVLGRLREEGVEAVVLDLRDDGGGALDAAIAICDQFLPEGRLIVETRGRDDALYDRYVTSGNGQFLDWPLVVLVNHQSASASEIVAACLQDHGRAKIAGQRTYGKGTVQKLIPVESGRSLLKLTTASYRRPNGKNIHRTAGAKETDDWGVSPDEGLEVKLDDAEYEAYVKYRADRDLWGDPPRADEQSAPPFVDRQLEKAVEHLQSVLNAGEA